jgi:hypothetical protein
MVQGAGFIVIPTLKTEGFKCWIDDRLSHFISSNYASVAQSWPC